MLGVVYRCSSLKTSRSFIGQSLLPPRLIAQQHYNAALKLRSTGFSNQEPFHSALLCEGFDNFSWETLIECQNQKDLDYNERLARDYYRIQGGLYNVDYKPTNITVAKLTGRKRTEETKARMRLAWTTRPPYSEAAREIFRQSKLGIKHSVEHNLAISRGCQLAMTPEAKKRRSDANKGKWFPYSQVKKMSISAKARWARVRAEKERMASGDF